MKSKQAVLIIAHNQPQLLKLLIKQLDHECIDIFVHVDNKDMKSEELRGSCKFSCLYIYQSAYHVGWGSFSLIQCELFLLEKALENKYCYYHLISGVDFPIKNVDTIISFFSCKNEEFVELLPDLSAKSVGDRMRYYYFFTQLFGRKGARIDSLLLPLQHLLKIDRLKDECFSLGKGGQWFSITNEFAEEVCRNKAWIYNHFKYTYCCDEVFIQTMLLNSARLKMVYTQAEKNCSTAKRFIDWERGWPYVFRKEDAKILKESPAFFARKFDYENYPEIIDLLVNGSEETGDGD